MNRESALLVSMTLVWQIDIHACSNVDIIYAKSVYKKNMNKLIIKNLKLK